MLVGDLVYALSIDACQGAHPFVNGRESFIICKSLICQLKPLSPDCMTKAMHYVVLVLCVKKFLFKVTYAHPIVCTTKSHLFVTSSFSLPTSLTI